jgi:DNA (cytosine-5)-methyltransferase 1
MKNVKHIDLFSGIGGFALATESVWPSVEHIFCDNEPFSQAIIKKHWPEAEIVPDIRQFTINTGSDEHRTLTKKIYEKKEIQGVGRETLGARKFVGADILTGGFPCQPFSQAGRRRGTEDSRHLWPEMLRVIREFHPRWIIGENVSGLATWNNGVVLEQIHTDLENENYEVQAFIIPAVSVNAPHRRDRIWIVAHSKDTKCQRRGGRDNGNPQGDDRQVQATGHCASLHENAPDTKTTRLQQRRDTRGTTIEGSTCRRGFTDHDSNASYTTSKQTHAPKSGGLYTKLSGESWNQNWLEVATRLCTLDDGLSNELARPRGWRNAALKGAGNAIVPPVAAEIMRAIEVADTPEYANDNSPPHHRRAA